MPCSVSQLWLCPACQLPLGADDDQASRLVCEKGHSYDRARQGYFNLLLANQKQSRDPGDSREMIAARREFLAAGHYNFLSTMLCEVMAPMLNNTGARVCDLGCGDGSYLRALTEHFPQAEFWGCDISKHAVKRAASYVERAELCVASSYQLPLAAHSQNVLLSVFSPVNADEIKRLLSPNGIFVRVLPGEQHLMQLKRALYRDAQEHSPPKPLPGFIRKTLLRTGELSRLGREDLANLIAMTPLQWRGDAKGKHALLDSAPLDMQFDFIIEVFTCD